MLTGEQFAAGASKFAELWNESGHHMGPWQWIPCSEPFARNMVSYRSDALPYRTVPLLHPLFMVIDHRQCACHITAICKTAIYRAG